MLNGQPVSYKVNTTSSGLLVSIPFNASSMPDGSYELLVEVSNGLTYDYTYTVQNNYNLASTSAFANEVLIVAIISLIIGVIALILAIILSRRRPSTVAATMQTKEGGTT